MIKKYRLHFAFTVYNYENLLKCSSDCSVLIVSTKFLSQIEIYWL